MGGILVTGRLRSSLARSRVFSPFGPFWGYWPVLGGSLAEESFWRVFEGFLEGQFLGGVFRII